MLQDWLEAKKKRHNTAAPHKPTARQAFKKPAEVRKL
jgi:hypothetical protein